MYLPEECFKKSYCDMETTTFDQVVSSTRRKRA